MPAIRTIVGHRAYSTCLRGRLSSNVRRHTTPPVHTPGPPIPVQRHVQARLLELGIKVAGSRKLYLDKCFWVRLRDHATGTRSTVSTAALFDLIRNQVRGAGLLCPISSTLFIELMRQSDLRTRAATAELIDEFSTGVSLVPDDERFDLEVETLLLTKLGHGVEPIEHRVWSRVAFVFGIQHPVPHADLPQDEIQIGFFDHLWNFPLVRILQVIGNREAPDPRFTKQAELLNKENAAHAHELRSFQQTYRDELAGALELALPQVQRTIDHLFRSAGGTGPATWTDQHVRQMHAMLVAIAKTREGRMALRTAHISASIHAATRWARTKRLTSHDLPDFLHAQGAIAYCDAFFTDGPTKHRSS